MFFQLKQNFLKAKCNTLDFIPVYFMVMFKNMTDVNSLRSICFFCV